MNSGLMLKIALTMLILASSMTAVTKGLQWSNTVEFDTVNCGKPAIIPVAGSIYAIAYEGSGDSGYLKTIEILPNSRVTSTIIDTLVFDSTKISNPTIIAVSTSIFAVAYRDSNSSSSTYRSGILKTIEILLDGSITDTVIDTFVFDTRATEPSMLHVAGDVFAVAYEGSSGDGFLKTVEIDPTGVIADLAIDTLEFDTTDCDEPEFIHVGGNIYGIAYEGPGSDGVLKTVEIWSNGSITDMVVDTFIFDASKISNPAIIHVSGDVYLIAYRDSNSSSSTYRSGLLETVEIAPNGTIVKKVIDKLVFESADGAEPDIIHTRGNLYAIAYKGPGSDGFLRTVELKSNGVFTDGKADTLEFDTSSGVNPRIFHVWDKVYGVVYEGPGGDGFLRTVVINPSPIVSGLMVEGMVNPLNITTLTPIFNWTYHDVEGDAQSHWEIEVGTSLGGDDMWDLNNIAGVDASVVYDGIPLSKNITYYVRVAVEDGNDWSDWESGLFKVKAGGESMETSTGTGEASFDVNIGVLSDLSAVDEGLLPVTGKPDRTFPHGFFSFTIRGLTPGATAVVNITLPSTVPVGAEYWKYHASRGGWIQIPLGDDDGDKMITITLVDGGLGDDDGAADGVIIDQGGLGVPSEQPPEDHPEPPPEPPLKPKTITLTLEASPIVVDVSTGAKMITVEAKPVTSDGVAVHYTYRWSVDGGELNVDENTFVDEGSVEWTINEEGVFSITCTARSTGYSDGVASATVTSTPSLHHLNGVVAVLLFITLLIYRKNIKGRFKRDKEVVSRGRGLGAPATVDVE